MQVKRNIFTSTSLVLLATVCGLCLLVASGAMFVGAISLSEQVGTIGDRPLPSVGPSLALVENPEVTIRVLESLIRSILYSASAADLQLTNSVAQKRGLDLGISRGFSGSQAGKHLMGLSAASFANGPGR